MDILPADNMKNDIRVVMWFLRRKLRKEYGITLKEMEEDLENCGNPVIASMWKDIKQAAGSIEEVYQKKTLTEFPMVALWIFYKDTAYNAPFMYIMKNILEKSDKLLPYANKYYKEPKDWYVNAWHDAKEHTAGLKESGKIPDESAIMAPDEQIFVPKLQQKMLNDIDAAVKRKRMLFNIGAESLNDDEEEKDAGTKGG